MYKGLEVKRGILLSLCFAVVLLGSGCAAYPIKNNNLLSAPLVFKYQLIQDSSSSKEKIIADARLLLVKEGYIFDSLAESAYSKYAPRKYESVIADINSYGSNLIAKKVRLALSSKESYTSNLPLPKFDKDSTRLIMDSGNYEYEITLFDPKYRKPLKYPDLTYTAKIDSKVKGILLNRNGYIEGRIDSVSTVTNVDVLYKGRNPSSASMKFFDFDLNGFNRKLNALVSEISDLKVNVKDKIHQGFINEASSRYRKSNSIAIPLIEKKFNVNFETAKARIQRNLGGYKYDEQKSTFTFGESNEFAFLWFSKIICERNVVISLFPDRNDTVITIGGNYTSVVDNYGGAGRYGEEFVNKKTNDLIAELTALLSN
ncbi:hypothetical protein ACFQ0F_06795 [Paraperlucidibaca wandonensis]|uniref:LPP20 lipoprotein n=1 Tax=Paraperlucidibaca wandonensis TaxID=1268273 RepID=A0ABW3HH75_9GAMM